MMQCTMDDGQMNVARPSGNRRRAFRFDRQTTLGPALLLATGLATLVGGCAGDRSAVPGPVTPMPVAEAGQASFSQDAPATYQVLPQDVLSIKVYGEPDFSFDRVAVSQSGTVSMPFVGDVPVSGLTAGEVAARLRGVLSRHLVKPQVAVNVVEYGSQRVTVEGSVTHAGVFVVPPGTTLLGALALAGEPDRLGLVRQIAVFRTDAGGRSVAVFDLHKVRQGTMIDPVLRGNDRVVVGTSGLARAYQDLLSLIPAAAIFSRF